MCSRDHITSTYRNCTAKPRHTMIKISFRLCAYVGTSACKGFVDNYSFGTSTVRGGICPKY